MAASVRTRRVFAVTLTIAAMFAMAGSSPAQEPPDTVFDLPAGLACNGFDLRVEVWGGTQVSKEFTDKNDNVVRLLLAGKGSALAFTNLATGALFSVKASGSVANITFNPDGSSRWVTTGHNVLILYPSDVPAGPSTTLQVGRVVFTVDTSGIFTVISASGKTTDICAVLSG